MRFKWVMLISVALSSIEVFIKITLSMDDARQYSIITLSGLIRLTISTVKTVD